MLTLHQSDSDDSASAWYALSPWEGKSPEGSLVHTEAEQVELIMQDSSARWHEALSSVPQGYPPARQAGCLPPPGRCYWSNSPLLGIMTISLRVFLFFCFGERENALLSIFLCLCVLKMSVPSTRLVKFLRPESLCLVRSRCLSWL